MLGMAQECPDLKKIAGTTDVIEEMNRVCLSVASLIQEYTGPSAGEWKSAYLCVLPDFNYRKVVRTIKYQMTNDMKSRINQYQTMCNVLKDKFNTRVAIETNNNVNQLSTSCLDDHFGHCLRLLQPRSSELFMTIRSVYRS